MVFKIFNVGAIPTKIKQSSDNNSNDMLTFDNEFQFINLYYLGSQFFKEKNFKLKEENLSHNDSFYI